MDELRPGLELDARFVLVRRLGRGGSGEVWLATERANGRPVALKFVDHALAAAELARVRALPAGHVVPVREATVLDGRSALVMDYLEGGDLGRFRGRPWTSWARAVDDVVAALEAAHAAGLVHRDLKCGNVLLDADGRARLADFGQATQAGAGGGGGSPYNASPQQLRGEPAAPADDLYALGALLYELVSGHPPWYPDISRDKVLHDPVPPLQPRARVPVAVRELALRLLAKSPGERPASAAEVRARLQAAQQEDDEARPPPAHEITAPAPRRAARRAGWLPLGIAALVAAGVAVFVWLPERVEQRSAELAERARGEAEAASQRRQQLAEQSARDAELKAAADAAREPFERALQALDTRAAARWATQDFAAARSLGEQAAQRYAVRDYAAARQGWEQGSERLAAIEQRRPAALAAALKDGERALRNGQVAAAREAYSLALAIEPGHAAAQAGLARAGRLEEAWVAVDEALAHERAGRMASAEEAYRRALAIEGSLPAAREGLARLAARRAGDAYAAAMARGLEELAAGRNEAARTAFERALALRPGSPEAREALDQLEQGQRAAALQTLESRARAAEAAEDWAGAVANWQQALAMDPGLEAARAGLARSRPRAELQARLEALIQNPERLWNEPGRDEARAVLSAAAQAGVPRQRLQARAAELDRLLAAARTPVRLPLRSDGLTSVVIYRVGQFGRFESRDVELLPGRYTVVGTRSGYRDVRREVELRPGETPQPLVISCEEPV